MKKKLLVGLATGLSLVGMVGMANAVPMQWTGSGANNNWYELVLAPSMTWTDANAAANLSSYLGLSGHLATITSADESSFVFSQLSVGNLPAWLGGYQEPDALEPLADWQWVTGEAWTYTNWATGEPNNSTWGDEDALSFAFFKADGTWNDAPTGYNSYSNGAYVVEYEAVPEPATMLLFGTGLIGIAGLARRKKK